MAQLDEVSPQVTSRSRRGRGGRGIEETPAGVVSLVAYRAERSPDEVLHEVRSSFAGVAKALRVLLDHGDPLPGGRMETMLLAEVDRLERLLTGARDGLLPERPVPDVVEQVVLSHRLRGQQIDFTADDVSIGWCDVLAEILDILLSNAAVHAPGMPVTVRVRQRSDLLSLTIRDQGPGVPDALRARIFDRGARGPGSPGDGLGLYVARRLVRGVGGGLRLLDDVDGTSFEVWIPLVQEDLA